jgi:hypothetical protein
MKKRLLLVLAIFTGIFLLSASIVWAAPVNLAATGQTTSYQTGDDGDLQKGVAIPPPYQLLRFTDNGDGTVTDHLTGLMWAKNANANGTKTWSGAIDYANNLSLGTSCGGPRTDWRLPNIKELESLTDYSNADPALPAGHPFTSVQSDYYWSSTTLGYNTEYAWNVNMFFGYLFYHNFKSNSYYVWPVRSGN